MGGWEHSVVKVSKLQCKTAGHCPCLFWLAVGITFIFDPKLFSQSKQLSQCWSQGPLSYQMGNHNCIPNLCNTGRGRFRVNVEPQFRPDFRHLVVDKLLIQSNQGNCKCSSDKELLDIMILTIYPQKQNQTCISWTKFKFFTRAEHFPNRSQAFARSQHGFLRSEQNVNLNNFQHLGCMGVSVFCNFLWTLW